MSVSDIIPCIKMDNSLVNFIFWSYEMMHITLRKWGEKHLQKNFNDTWDIYVPLLLNSLNSLQKNPNKCSACQAFYLFFFASSLQEEHSIAFSH